MLAKPYLLRSWRPAVLGSALFLACVYTVLPGTGKSYGYPRRGFHGISNFLADRVYENTLFRPGNEAQVHRQWNFTDPCRDFPDTSDILLVMKTGATEAIDKLPVHLLTALQCMPDFLLFSDMEQQIGQWHIYDSLAAVADEIKEKHAEFNLYKAQIDCPVSQRGCVDARGKDSTAWALDKYKFLHIVARAWTMRPGRAWYVFTEADTYVFWPNLVTYLRDHISANDDMYVGSVSLINDFPFAHGGSGYAISGRLVRKLVENHGDVAGRFDGRAPEYCCGDLMLALALQETEGAKVRQAHPMFNGEKPVSMPFGPTHWCEPIFTMHHMSPEEISAVWQYEQTRKSSDILLMKDLYETFIRHHLRDDRADWDNLSDDVCYLDQENQAALERADQVLRSRQKNAGEMSAVEKAAHQSAEHCGRVCEFEGYSFDHELPAGGEELQAVLRAKQREQEHNAEFRLNRQCFQWRYHDGVCCTSRSFKLGMPRKVTAGDGQEWRSGWYVKGIEDWIAARGECTEVGWRQPF